MPVAKNCAFNTCSCLLMPSVGSNTVPPVPDEQSADNQPAAATEASNSPMDVDSPTAGFCTLLIIVLAVISGLKKLPVANGHRG